MSAGNANATKYDTEGAQGLMKTQCSLTREIIPIGRENAISRGELAELLGMSDRDVRDVVARLRRQGGNDPYVICSSSHNPPGYWRTNSDVEIMAYWAETHSRAKNTLAALKDVERFKALEGA